MFLNSYERQPVSMKKIRIELNIKLNNRNGFNN